MKLESKVTALERASTPPTKLCRVTYKAGQGPEGEILLPMDKALQEARTGHVKDIRFPLTFNEEQAERADRTVAAYASFDMDAALTIEPHEQVIDHLVREVKSRHVRRLRDGLCTVEYGFVLEDLLTACERTADHCSNVAVEMLQVAEGKLEAHEYLGALKAGELRESAAFSKLFARYMALYQFPAER